MWSTARQEFSFGVLGYLGQGLGGGIGILAYCLPPPRSKISMPRMPRKATRSIFSVAEKVAGVLIDVGELLLLPNTCVLYLCLCIYVWI